LNWDLGTRSWLRICFAAVGTALAVVMSLSFGQAAIAKETRVALVIGNGAYRHAGALRNPPNDAHAIATMIGRMGFDSTDLSLDRDRDAFRDELRKFATKASDADIALVYFAGHGIEIAGVNYLLPTDVRIRHEDDVRDEAIPLEEVLHAVRAARKLRVVVLDACRNNPFANRMIRRSGGRRGGNSGLAPIDSSGEVLVAYAAKHGTTASDGGGENSPYAEGLLRHMPTPGLDIRIMFGHVRDQVLNATGQRQEPYIYGSVGGQQIYLTRSVSANADAPRYEKERWVSANGPFAGTPQALATDPMSATRSMLLLGMAGSIAASTRAALGPSLAIRFRPVPSCGRSAVLAAANISYWPVRQAGCTRDVRTFRRGRNCDTSKNLAKQMYVPSRRAPASQASSTSAPVLRLLASQFQPAPLAQ
jgi:hypothetical protein